MQDSIIMLLRGLGPVVSAQPQEGLETKINQPRAVNHASGKEPK